MQIKNQIKFLIPGNPVAQIRPRFSARLVNGKIFSQVVRSQPEQEGYFKQMVSKQLPEHFEIFEGPVSLSIDCRFTRPKSHWGTGRNADLLKNSAPRFCQRAIDCDNLAKFVGDCLNGIVYKDDRQIFTLKVEKFWAKVGCTIVNVGEINSK